MKKLLIAGRSIVAAAALTFSFTALAAPTLNFNGAISFDQSSSLLTFDGEIIAAADVPAPSPVGADLSFSAAFLGSSFNPILTPFPYDEVEGTFGTTPGNDLTVSSVSSLFLTGDFLALSLQGNSDITLPGGAVIRTPGSLNGVLDSTGGSLENYFSTGDLFAVTVNLVDGSGASMGFSRSMFDSDFEATANGSITGVPLSEPAVGLLLALGVIGILASRRNLATNNTVTQH